MWRIRSHNISVEEKYGGLEISDVKKMKALEEENARLKRIIVNQAIDIGRLKELSTKNGTPFHPQVRRSVLAPGGKTFGTESLVPI